jgi:hypothetical protein
MGKSLALIDEESGTVWRALAGEAIAGPHVRKLLRQLTATAAFWFASLDHFP